MYLFLDCKEQDINNKPYYLVYILHCDYDKGNYSVCRVYVQKTKELESDLPYINQFEDISNRIGFKVRNDGKVVLTLK